MMTQPRTYPVDALGTPQPYPPPQTSPLGGYLRPVSDEAFPFFESPRPLGTWISPGVSRAGANLILEAFPVLAGVCNVEVWDAPQGGQLSQSTDSLCNQLGLSSHTKWLAKGPLSTVAVRLTVLSGTWAVWGAFTDATSDRQIVNSVTTEFTAVDFKATGLTGATTSTRFAGGTASGHPTTGTFAVDDFVIDATGAIWVCTVGGTPGTWVEVGSGLPVGGVLTGTLPNPGLAAGAATGAALGSDVVTLTGTQAITGAKTLTAPHFTNPVVDSGGLTVSSGGITVSGASTITGTLGGLTGLTVASGGMTVTGNSNITGTLGGLTGLTVASGGAGITGFVSITGPGGTSATSALTVNNSTPSVLFTVRDDGLVTYPFPPGFAAGDKYLIIDASGNIHKSALGPAS